MSVLTVTNTVPDRAFAVHESPLISSNTHRLSQIPVEAATTYTRAVAQKSQPAAANTHRHSRTASSNTLNANPAAPDTSPKKSSPRKKRNPLAAARPRSQRRSPPPPHTPPENPLTWHDSEITGHDPTDPSDDGYGINGLGFKPTASMAWNRSQKRQKQITNWRSRESREARERRREKREGVELNKIHTIQKGAIQKKVKFDV